MTMRFTDATGLYVTLTRDGVDYTGPWPPVDGEWAKWVREVNGEPSPFMAPAPQSCARHQGLLALLTVGITEAMIDAKIDEIEDVIERETARIRFRSPTWGRNSPFIDFGKDAFGLTDAQVDQLFAAAATL